MSCFSCFCCYQSTVVNTVPPPQTSIAASQVELQVVQTKSVVNLSKQPSTPPTPLNSKKEIHNSKINPPHQKVQAAITHTFPTSPFVPDEKIFTMPQVPVHPEVGRSLFFATPPKTPSPPSILTMLRNREFDSQAKT